MTDQIENDKISQNYKELTEEQILEKAQEELAPIQESLLNKTKTFKEVREALMQINKWIQWTKLENADKKNIWKGFEKLTKLEENVDNDTLKNEFDNIVDLLKIATKIDLAGLKNDIQKTRHQIHEHPNSGRPADVEKKIEESANNLRWTIDNASQDQNPIAKKIWERMKKLMS